MEFFLYNYCMTIEEIKKYMKENGISQIELAEKSKLSLQTLRKIFCGKTEHPRIDTVQAIENALGLHEKATEETPTQSIDRLFASIKELPPEQQRELAPVIQHLINVAKK